MNSLTAVKTEIIDLCDDQPDEPAGAPTPNRKMCLIGCDDNAEVNQKITLLNSSERKINFVSVAPTPNTRNWWNSVRGADFPSIVHPSYLFETKPKRKNWFNYRIRWLVIMSGLH